jgi:hypothetical protein
MIVCLPQRRLALRLPPTIGLGALAQPFEQARAGHLDTEPGQLPQLRVELTDLVLDRRARDHHGPAGAKMPVRIESSPMPARAA